MSTTCHLGSSTPLNQVLLQAPGVVQDSYGQLHVRGDHDNLQYRINGVIIPEPITGFGQSIDPRFANQISLLTGALPAEYGYRTAGVIDISTKGADFQNGGSFTTLFGSNGFREAALEYAGTSGDYNFFYSGSVLRDDLGIENPTSTPDALHDTTTQTHQFAYLSKLIDESSRLSLMVGTSLNKFQIPDVPGQTSVYTLANTAPVSSSDLNSRQDETNTYEVLTYQASPTDRLDYQVAVFHRYNRCALSARSRRRSDLSWRRSADSAHQRVERHPGRRQFQTRPNQHHSRRSLHGTRALRLERAISGLHGCSRRHAD